MNIIIRLKRKHTFAFPLVRFVSGIRKVKSALLELHPTTGSTIKKMSTLLLASLLLLYKSGRKQFTVECLPKSKWMTLNDKRIFLEKNTLITSWLQTLVQELIGKGKDLKPFWTSQTTDYSTRLWLPTGIDSVGLPLTSSNISSRVTGLNSLFSLRRKINRQNKSSLRTSFPSFTSTRVETWEEEGTRSRKIRLYPTKKQVPILKQWMGTNRYVYNQALSAVKTEEDTQYDKYKLRDRFVTHKYRDGTINHNLKEWELNTPKDIRHSGIRDMCGAFKAAITNLKRGNIPRFKMGFRSRKKTSSISIAKTAIKKVKGGVKMYPKYLSEPIRVSKDKAFREVEFKKDCRLSYERGIWFLIVPFTKKGTKLSPLTSDTCALDPGVRSFQTGYSQSEVVDFKPDPILLKKLHEKLDLFRSLRAKKKITGYKYRRRHNKIYSRLTNLVDDLHYKTINYLTSTYEYILLPSFESQELSKKCNSTTSRRLLQLKHYRFKERLKDACKLKANCNVEIVTEEYTTKTCTGCGNIDRHVGSAEIYNCSPCGLRVGRDINGARNILLKTITEKLKPK